MSTNEDKKIVSDKDVILYNNLQNDYCKNCHHNKELEGPDHYCVYCGPKYNWKNYDPVN